jgi:hypothetical protein
MYELDGCDCFVIVVIGVICRIRVVSWFGGSARHPKTTLSAQAELVAKKSM